jgi:hypothetical protein
MRVAFDFLAATGLPVTESRIRGELEAVAGDTDPSEPGQSDVLTASLNIGQYLGLFIADKAARPEVWSVTADATSPGLGSAGAPLFASNVLRRICERTDDAIAASQEVPDLAKALAWFLDQDPTEPLNAVWDDTPGIDFGHGKAKSVLGNKTQWLAFCRWAVSLGLAVRLKRGARGAAIAADPATAIAGVLHLLRDGPADRWFDQLYELLPVLGSRRLREQLPYRVDHVGVSPAVAIAVRKLEHRGFLELAPMDDSPYSVALRMAGSTRHIGKVRMLRTVL